MIFISYKKKKKRHNRTYFFLRILVNDNYCFTSYWINQFKQKTKYLDLSRIYVCPRHVSKKDQLIILKSFISTSPRLRIYILFYSSIDVWTKSKFTRFHKSVCLLFYGIYVRRFKSMFVLNQHFPQENYVLQHQDFYTRSFLCFFFLT